MPSAGRELLSHSSRTAQSLLGGEGRNRTIPALFTGVNDLFAERIKLSLSLPSLSRLIRLTEGFTEGIPKFLISPCSARTRICSFASRPLASGFQGPRSR